MPKTKTKPKANVAEQRHARLERISAFMSDASDAELRLLDGCTRALRRSSNPRRPHESFARAMQRAVDEAGRAHDRREGKRPPHVPTGEALALVATLASFALWSFNLMEREERAEGERLERELNDRQRIEHLARALAGCIERGSRHVWPS